MQTQESKQIIERFYSAIEALIAKGELKGVATYCRWYGIDRRNFITQRNDHNRKYFQLSWLQPMILKHHINAEWLITGHGRMFLQQ